MAKKFTNLAIITSTVTAAGMAAGVNIAASAHEGPLFPSNDTPVVAATPSPRPTIYITAEPSPAPTVIVKVKKGSGGSTTATNSGSSSSGSSSNSGSSSGGSTSGSTSGGTTSGGSTGTTNPPPANTGTGSSK